MCVAEVLGMAPFSMFLALEPLLREVWSLSNTESGWISAAYYAGYMVAVPVLVSLTDRYDARSIWLASTLLAAIAAFAFGLTAQGVWTASLFQFIAGASLAGTYMPGLKLIADRMAGVIRPRFVAFYTTSFTLGASASFYAIGQLEEALAWRAAVVASAAGPVCAWLLIHSGLSPLRASRAHEATPAHHWNRVLRSSDSMRYVVAYACHTWELFAVRAWLVPFFVFVERWHGRATFASAATLAALISLIGVPASLAGAELSGRIDRRKLVTVVMLVSAVASVLFGLAASSPWPVVLAMGVIHSVFVSADSAALTSGLVAVSPPESRGTAMAIYSTAGFAAASAGSFAIGAVLDLLGGQSATSWAFAFVLVGGSNILGALVLARARA